MNTFIRLWVRPYLENPQYLNLCLLIIFMMTTFSWFGGLLTPVMAAIIIAYLLQWPISFLRRLKVPHLSAVLLVYSIFMSFFIGLCGLVIPLLLKQLSTLLTELPQITAKAQTLLLYLPERYPHYISAEQIQNVLLEIRLISSRLGQWLFSMSVTSIRDIVGLTIYAVLVPLLIYFLLVDQQKILAWVKSCLPKHHELIIEVWQEVHMQIGGYVRGRALEIVIVWVVTAVTFTWMKLPYAMLLGLLTGLSSLIPYLGTVLATIPVVIISFLEWGWSREFIYLISVYSIITALDSNVLAPLLFSEAVALHPIATIVATLIFGGTLGFWGIFFAIPLAILVKALFNVFKRAHSLYEHNTKEK